MGRKIKLKKNFAKKYKNKYPKWSKSINFRPKV